MQLKGRDGVLETAGHERGALAAHVGRFREIREIIQGGKIALEPFPAGAAVKASLAQGIQRACFDASGALFSCLGKACLLRIDEGIVSQFRLGHEASQSPGASFRSNQQMVDAETPQVYQVAEMFVRPAGH